MCVSSRTKKNFETTSCILNLENFANDKPRFEKHVFLLVKSIVRASSVGNKAEKISEYDTSLDVTEVKTKYKSQTAQKASPRH